jgi:hypothetical protein
MHASKAKRLKKFLSVVGEKGTNMKTLMEEYYPPRVPFLLETPVFMRVSAKNGRVTETSSKKNLH